MFSNLGGWTGLILVVAVFLVFAAPKLPALARNLGQSLTIFKKEVKVDQAVNEDAVEPSEPARVPTE
jgi:sec-independent protein translocase protein TatA